MAGVEILATEEVGVEYAFNWEGALIMFWGILVVFLLLAFWCEKNMRGTFTAIAIFGAIVACFFGGAFGASAQQPKEYLPQFKVTISDEVKMTEFLEKYEIIDQEGKIYTVRERHK